MWQLFKAFIFNFLQMCQYKKHILTAQKEENKPDHNTVTRRVAKKNTVTTISSSKTQAIDKIRIWN